MGKMVVLKPVVWNGSGYLGPSGDNTSSGYAGEHGYGHEEWNGRSDWVWKGWKVFHTQGKGQMFEYAVAGDLGIVMTTMREGRFYAVGVACAVYENDNTDRAAIAKDLRLKANGARIWKLDKVRRLKVDRAEFNAHWEDAHAWVQWRCPQTHYAWFDQPVEIVPDDVIPAIPPRPRRRAIIKMHSSYQAVRPDQALAIIGKAVPSSHPVRAWLSTGDFDAVPTRSVRDAPPPRVRPGRSAGAAVNPYTRYLQENEFQVTPKHHLLQSAFERYLARTNAKGIVPNVERVDIRYYDANCGPVLAEIKPSDEQTVRFAIRTALGQLLDYRQGQAGDPKLLVVVGCEPTSSADIALAIDNGFGIAWPEGDSFAVRWPAL